MSLSSLITALILPFLLSITVHSQRSDETLTKCADMNECVGIKNLTNIHVQCSGKTSCTHTNISTPRPKGGSVKCSGRESCKEAAIATLGKKDTECSGWKSCFAAKSITTRDITCNGALSCAFFAGAGSKITTTRNVVCGGDYACQRQEPMQSAKKITCSGFNGCVLNTLYADGDIECTGARACVFSTLMAQGSVTCSGRESCHNSDISSAQGVLLLGDVAAFKTTITDTPYVFVGGATALDKGCTIDSGSVSHMTVRMEASSQRMNSAYMICRNGATCSLICSSSGCVELIYQCESGATCNIDPAECATNPGGDVDGITCPTMTNSKLSSFDLMDDDDDDMIMIHKSAKEEDDDGALTEYDTSCITERECESQEFTGAAEGTIYCEGSAACQGATIRDRKTECNGESSCRLVDITDAMGPYCYGSLSCSNAINMISTYNIYCYGESSCQRAALHSEVITECRGASSCYKSDIVQPAGYYTACYGAMSCSGATITNGDTVSILCRGGSSCEGAELVTSYEGKDFGEYYAVQCYGEYSCKNAIITTTGTYSKVHIAGYQSGEGAEINIRGVEVMVTGYRGLKFGTIDSEDSSFLTVNLFGKQAGFRATFICRRGSQCSLKCKGDSCQGLDYLCEHGSIACNISPTGCESGAKRVGNYICPKLEHVQANYDMTDIIEQKKIEMKQDIDNDDEELLLFEGEINIIKENEKLLSLLSFNNMNHGLLFAIIAILGFIGLISYYIWCKVKVHIMCNEQYKILN